MTPRHPVSEVIPATEEHPRVEVVRSARRRRTVTAQPADDGSIRLLVPDISTDEQIRGYLADLLPRVQRTRRRAQGKRRHFASDDYLLSRAQYLVEQYLPELSGKVPESIRWVSNQRTRWGSATPGAGRIRISDALTGAPEYVVDAVLYHELCHFVVLHHNAQFHRLQDRLPRLAQAQAFLAGIEFARTQEAHERRPEDQS